MNRRDPKVMAAKQAEWERMTPAERDAANAEALRTKPTPEPADPSPPTST
jgi:hypothetical protein